LLEKQFVNYLTNNSEGKTALRFMISENYEVGKVNLSPKFIPNTTGIIWKNYLSNIEPFDFVKGSQTPLLNGTYPVHPRQTKGEVKQNVATGLHAIASSIFKKNTQGGKDEINFCLTRDFYDNEGTAVISSLSPIVIPIDPDMTLVEVLKDRVKTMVDLRNYLVKPINNDLELAFGVQLISEIFAVLDKGTAFSRILKDKQDL